MFLQKLPHTVIDPGKKERLVKNISRAARRTLRLGSTSVGTTVAAMFILNKILGWKTYPELLDVLDALDQQVLELQLRQCSSGQTRCWGR
jgi:hypothetical protein